MADIACAREKGFGLSCEERSATKKRAMALQDGFLSAYRAYLECFGKSCEFGWESAEDKGKVCEALERAVSTGAEICGAIILETESDECCGYGHAATEDDGSTLDNRDVRCDSADLLKGCSEEKARAVESLEVCLTERADGTRGLE